MSRRPRQFSLNLRPRRRRGGRRNGAGRKSIGRRPGVPHRQRQALASRHPVHVTIRIRRDLPNLRTKRRLQAVRACFQAAARSPAVARARVTDWSLQSNHIHMLVEAKDARTLSAAVKGINVRIAKALNRLLGRRGQVIADRYHARILRTPREVRNALVYVLNNARKHGHRLPTTEPDVFSSGWWFDGWSGQPRLNTRGIDPPTALPRTWLRAIGWRRRRLLQLDERPAGTRHNPA